MNDFAKILIFSGLILVAVGLIALTAGKIPGIGRLPGDFFIRKGNASFYFPITTCLFLSLLLTLIFNLFGRK